MATFIIIIGIVFILWCVFSNKKNQEYTIKSEKTKIQESSLSDKHEVVIQDQSTQQSVKQTDKVSMNKTPQTSKLRTYFGTPISTIEELARESGWIYRHFDKFLSIKLGIAWTDVLAKIWTYELITEDDAHRYVDMYKKIKLQEELTGQKYEDLFGYIIFASTQYVCQEVSKVQFRIRDGVLHSVVLKVQYNNNFDTLSRKVKDMLKSWCHTGVVLKEIQASEEQDFVAYFKDKDNTTIYFSCREENNSTLTISYM